MRKIPVYSHPAAGWPSLIASTRKLMDYKALTRGSYSVFSSNQPNGGFDCPGCAWPDHKTHKTIDVCETGIKVLETMLLSFDNLINRHDYATTVSNLHYWANHLEVR